MMPSSTGRTSRRKHRAWLLLAGLAAIELGVAGCAEIPTTAVPIVMPTAPASATMTICDSSAASCSGATTFSLGAIRDLNISISWQNVTEGTHAQSMSVFSPDGELFQAMEIAFAIPEGSPGTATTVQTLPVVGTWITQRQITGTWKITVALDDQDIATSSVLLTR